MITRLTSLFLMLLVAVPAAQAVDRHDPPPNKLEAGAHLAMDSYRYGGLVSPFLGTIVETAWTTTYLHEGDVAIDGAVGLRTGYLHNLLGSGDVGAALVPLEVQQQTTVRFRDRYALSLALGSGTLVHLEPGRDPVWGFAISAGLGNRLRILPWLDLSLAVSLTHATPRGVDVTIVSSRVGLVAGL